MADSPTVARWELSRRLSYKREFLKLDVKTITDQLDFSRNYYSAVENDRTVIARDKLQQLVEILAFDAQESAELLELREAARARGWWEAYPTFDDETRRFLGLEDGASRIRTYDALVLPGLLQTEDYARSILRSDPAISETQLDEAFEVRERRQQLLLGNDAVPISAIVSEAALRQYVGGPAVQLRQLRHLAHLIETRPDSVEVRILPFTTDPGIIVTSSTMSFFDFDRPELPTVVFQEAVRALGAVEQPEPAYLRLDIAWENGWQRSLDREQSLQLIGDVIKGIES